MTSAPRDLEGIAFNPLKFLVNLDGSLEVLAADLKTSKPPMAGIDR